MAVHDTIGDFITIIRNASRAGKESISVPHSNLRESLAKILADDGYVRSMNVTSSDKGIKTLLIELKYVGGESAIKDIQRYSKPGRRMYSGYTDIPKVLDGLGISIISTSKGLLKDSVARREKVGGEILCTVY